MRSLSVFVRRLGTLAVLALSVTACSSTPDRYAFWRDDTPVTDTETPNAEPNLADIPASPNVDQARQDMKDLQTKLTADRDAATQQAQTDKDVAAGKITQPLASINSSPSTKNDSQSAGLPPGRHEGRRQGDQPATRHQYRINR